MNKKAPVFRVCCVTHELFPKEQLYRVVRTNVGVIFDINQTIKGRGAYIKKDLSTIQEGFKRNSLSKTLRCKVDENVYLELIQALSKEGRK